MTASQQEPGRACSSKFEAVLGFPAPTAIPCGYIEGHIGQHHYEATWGDTAALQTPPEVAVDEAASQQEPGDHTDLSKCGPECITELQDAVTEADLRAIDLASRLHQAEERADPQAIDGIFEKLDKPPESNLYNVPGYIGEVQRSLHQAEEALREAWEVDDTGQHQHAGPGDPGRCYPCQVLPILRGWLSTKDTKPQEETALD